jgi:hypothetical protein
MTGTPATAKRPWAILLVVAGIVVALNGLRGIGFTIERGSRLLALIREGSVAPLSVVVLFIDTLIGVLLIAAAVRVIWRRDTPKWIDAASLLALAIATLQHVMIIRVGESLFWDIQSSTEGFDLLWKVGPSIAIVPASIGVACAIVAAMFLKPKPDHTDVF